MFDSTWPAWLIFNGVVIALLVIDLTLFHRRPREMTIREALGWSAFWVALACILNVLIYVGYNEHWFGFGVTEKHNIPGKQAALEFLTGYLIELSLSVDNLFVFLAVFGYFGVKGHHQHRVLFWGILGAVVLRAIMILAGVALIERFHWLIYVLGAFLIFTGLKLAFQRGDEHVDPSHNIVLRIARRVMPIHGGDHHGRFFQRHGGKLMATPLFLVLLVVETTDVVFALDSIPAILAVTKDPFVAYSSNIMAILGLRAMYFALAGLMGLFHYLRFGLAAVLIFVGVKMLLPAISGYHIPIGVSLTAVATLLGVSVLASLVWVKEHGLEESGETAIDAAATRPDHDKR